MPRTSYRQYDAFEFSMPQEPVCKTVCTKELAAALDCDLRTIIKAAKAGEIPVFRIDHELRFDPPAVCIALSNNARFKKGVGPRTRSMTWHIRSSPPGLKKR
jgi:hypothetical protein